MRIMLCFVYLFFSVGEGVPALIIIDVKLKTPVCDLYLNN